MEQLQNDFGEVPPNQLKPSNIHARVFTIKYMNSLEKYIFDVMSSIKLLNYIKKNPNDAYVLMLLKDIGNKDAMDGLLNVKQSLLQEWGKFGILGRILFLCLSVLAAPFVFILLLYNAAKMLINIFRGGDKFEQLGGFHSALPFYREFIYINKNNRDKSGLQVEHIITHEHIHLLQSSFRAIENDFGQPIKYIRSPNIILGDEHLGDRLTLYWLEKHEVEARLHEVILSIYRMYGELPMSIPAFFNALVMNKEIGLALKNKSHCFFNDKDSDVFCKPYEMRSVYVGQDIFILLGAMRDIDTRIRFALEVLAPMYANLLRYYGDEEASMNFGRQIQRPNLYDKLYLNR